MAKIDLTAQRLRELLHYDPETGVFTWRTSGHRRTAGQAAGSINKVYGYMIVGVAGAHFRAHRLAWFYVHGVWPSNGLDHIDNDKLNNRIGNLRDVPHLWNAQNRLKPRISATGIRGVRKIGARFYARVAADGVEIPLGGFATADEAHSAYLAAARRLQLGTTL